MAKKNKNRPERKIARMNKPLVVAERGYKCERCGSSEPHTIQLHHKDWNRFNNNFDNYELLCEKCHMKEHGFIRRDKKVEKVKGKKQRKNKNHILQELEIAFKEGRLTQEDIDYLLLLISARKEKPRKPIEI